ncbi:MAG: hypothetical protein ACXIUB_05055 [Wenzhouxiangella sp.]
MASFLLTSLLLGCAATENHRQQSDWPPAEWLVPLSDAEQREVEAIQATGRLLYTKDQYAARASRALMRAADLSRYPNFAGWIGQQDGEDYVVSFFELDEDTISLIADVRFDAEDEVSVSIEPERQLAERERSMLRARMAALEAGWNDCSDRFNTVVLPTADDQDYWEVYVLAATTVFDLMVVGGHRRVEVDRETGSVRHVQTLSNTCMNMDITQAIGEGGERGVLAMTQVVAPMPLAIYPLLSQMHEIPIVLMTDRGRWLVSGDQIRFLK